MPITAEALEHAWETRNKTTESYIELAGYVLTVIQTEAFKGVVSKVSNLSPNELGEHLSTFVMGLKLGYEIAKTERLEELCRTDEH